MHGIRKSKVPKSQEELDIAARKTQQFKTVVGEIMNMRRDRVFDDHSLQLTQQMLRLNPDFELLWTYRRETLDVVANPVYEMELKLTKEALMKNPKSYPSWFHRQWAIDKDAHVDLNFELELCNKLLELDGRNFHCWNYRRYIVSKLNRSRTQELEFAMLKIEENFSNYSAFHYRAQLLGHDLWQQDRSQWETEVVMVQQAVFTEPDDQSAWFYFKWLLEMVQNPPDLENQLGWMEELVEMEHDQAKWPMTLLAYIYKRLSQLTATDEWKHKCSCLYDKLIHLDSDHAAFYKDQSACLEKSVRPTN